MKLDISKNLKLATIAIALVMSPFVGNGAIQQDLFKPMFNPSHQIMDKYVINQNFQAQQILKQDLISNKNYFESFSGIQPISIVAPPTKNYTETKTSALDAFIESGIAQTNDRKLSLQVFALQSAVKFSYSGVLTASFLVNERNGENVVALSKNLNSSSTVSFQNIENSIESCQMISLAMSF